jgi:hypothetical protein
MALRMLTKVSQYYLVCFFDDETMSIVCREKIVDPDDLVLIKGNQAELEVRIDGRKKYKAMLISF